MPKKIKNYPNKSDYKPYLDKYNKDNGELPLADPSESNSHEVFRENESEKEGEHKPSAFDENKKEKESK